MVVHSKWIVANHLIQAKPMRLHQMRESGVMSLAGPIEGRLYAATTHGLYEFTDDGSSNGVIRA